MRVWDVASGNHVRTLNGHANEVLCVAVSNDGKWIASGSADYTVRIWASSDGRSHHILTSHSDWVRSVAFSPDGDQIVSGCDDQSIRVWDVISGHLVGTFDGHSAYVSSVKFTPNGDHIISGSCDKTIRIWNVKTGACVRTLQDDNCDGLNSVAVSADGQQIISGSDDGAARVWDLSSSSLLNLFQLGSRVQCVDISPDGTQIVTAVEERGLFLWDLPSHYPMPLKSVEFASHGQAILATFKDDSLREWGIDTLSHENGADDVKYSYVIGPHSIWGAESNTGEVVEKWDGGERVVCKIPISLYQRGSHLIHSGQHVVLWHEDGHLVHLNLTNTSS